METRTYYYIYDMSLSKHLWVYWELGNGLKVYNIPLEETQISSLGNIKLLIKMFPQVQYIELPTNMDILEVVDICSLLGG